MTDTPLTTDAGDDVKLTKREEGYVKELEHLASSLEEANLLYGSALDGMEPALAAAADKLAKTDLDAAMSVAEEDIAKKAEEVLQADVEGMTAIEDELNEDDAEEDELLAEEEAGPEEIAA